MNAGFQDYSDSLQQYSQDLSSLHEELQKAKDLSAVAEVQGKLLKIINQAAELHSTVAKSLKKSNSSILGKALALFQSIVGKKTENKPLETLQQSLARVGAYGRSLEAQIESKQKALIREQAAELLAKTYTQPASHPEPYEASFSVVRTAEKISQRPNLSATELNALKRSFIVERASLRIDDSAAINGEYIETLQTLAELLDRELQSTPSDRDLMAFKELVTTASTDAKQAFREKAAVMMAFTDKQMAVLKAFAEGKSPANDKEAVSWFEVAHQMHWDFENPFSIPITMEDFAQLAKNALSLPSHQFHSLLQDSAELRERLDLLAKAETGVRYYALGHDFNVDAHLDEVIAIKTAYLRALKEKSRELYQARPITVGVMGGGPGGWSRAFVAGIKGANVKLIDDRSTYTRPNVIKLQATKQMALFGMAERLKKKNESSDGSTVSISALEKSFMELATEVLGTVKVEGKFLNVLPDAKTGKAGYLYQDKEGKVEFTAADLIVDATGSNAAVASALMVGRQILSEGDLMVAIVLEKAAGDAKHLTKGREVVQLATPQSDYLLIQLDAKQQSALQKFKKSNPSKEKLQSFLKKLCLPSASKSKVSWISDFDVVLGERALPAELVGDTLVMQSGDAMATPDPKAAQGTMHAIQGSLPFSKAIDDMRQRSPTSQVHRAFTRAAIIQAQEVEELSFRSRGGVESATLAYHVKELVSKGKLSTDEAEVLIAVEEKVKFQIILTSAEKEKLQAIRAKAESDADLGIILNFLEPL